MADTQMTDYQPENHLSPNDMKAIREMLLDSRDDVEKAVEDGFKKLIHHLDGLNISSLIRTQIDEHSSSSSRAFHIIPGLSNFGTNTSELQKLKEDNKKLTRDKENLNSDLRKGRKNYDELERRFAETQERLSKMSEEKQNLKDQSSRFREIIIKGSVGDEISDKTIRESFVDLREQTQKLVRTFYKMDDWPKTLDLRTENHEKLFSLWRREGFSLAWLRNRARGMIFHMVNEDIFGQPTFGLDADEAMESGLVHFEATLNTIAAGKQRHEDDIAEWRTRTVQCASWLHASSLKPAKLEQKILGFITPLLEAKSGLAARKQRDEDLQVAVRKLCDDAFRFALRVRGLKDLYRCETPGDVLNSFAEAEPIASERRDGGMPLGSNVAFTIFGSLIKYSVCDGERLVLEKANVVIGE